jgi:broad specificity phosphatase PhoE
VDTQIDENWIELDYGEWDGMPLQAIKKETWNKWKTDSSFKPPKGESLEELGKRVRLSLNNIEKNTDQHLLIVTHVSPIKAALAWALDVNDSIAWKTRLETASFTQINIDSDTPVLTKFNHTAENRD